MSREEMNRTPNQLHASDYVIPESKPELTEFTKKVKNEHPLVFERAYESSSSSVDKIISKIGNDLIKACDIIDRLTAENRDLRLLINANKVANKMYAEAEKQWEFEKKQLKDKLKAKDEEIEQFLKGESDG